MLEELLKGKTTRCDVFFGIIVSFVFKSLFGFASTSYAHEEIAYVTYARHSVVHVHSLRSKVRYTAQTIMLESAVLDVTNSLLHKF